MASSTSTAAIAANKPHSQSIPGDRPSLVDGLVQHELMPASIQVRILGIVDATGSATIGEIVDGLPGHPDPVGAVVVMIRLGILLADLRGVLDQHTIVRRADPEPDPAAPGGDPTDLTPPAALVPGCASTPHDPPADLELFRATPFAADLVIGAASQRRDFGRVSELHRPGVYALLSSTSVYVGTGGNVGARIAGGQQPIEDVDTVVALVDDNGALTAEDARAVERMLWSRVAAFGDRRLVNGLPDGAPVTVDRYGELDVFLGEACLALRRRGLLFTRNSARSLVAGPRAEPRRAGPLRPFNHIPEGEILELSFGEGLCALAARQDNGWLLLRGSDVRIDAVASAGCVPAFLRSAWQHAGLLEPGVDGRSLVVTRDLRFKTGSSVAHFCTGAKGRGLAGWEPIDPDGGYDPETPALIAR
ncbi:MAG: hypothetical protein ACTHLT_18740 [Devosia sp.]